jgi:YNFM family putative membrane transporter
VLTDLASWRVALGALGAFSLVASLTVWTMLPPSRHFTRRPFRIGAVLAAFAAHLREPGLRMLFALPFLLMGSFVTLYNYIGYRLEAPPYQLSQTAAGAVFAVYLVGIASSAWMGRLADRFGRRRVLWIAVLIMLAGILMTLAHALALIVLGIAIATFGFFGGHSVASSWVARRARTAKGQASSLYLFAYYLGSSAIGSAGGFAWTLGGWTGVVAGLSLLILLAFGLSLRLARLPPLPEP